MKYPLIVLILAILLFLLYTTLTKKSNNAGDQVSVFPISSKEKVNQTPTNTNGEKTIMRITSSAFLDNQPIPKEFTCKGDNINPPLEFLDIPKDAKSLALIVKDPDTPMGIIWYHWIVFNMPPATMKIEQNSKPDGVEGRGSSGNGYQGPCPPDPKPHRYIFTLYALDEMLNVPNSTDAQGLQAVMRDHILAEAKLTGLYTGPAQRK